MTYKGLEINEDEKQCYINSQPIKLSKKEYELITFFLSNPNHIYSREELLEKFWKEGDIFSRVIDSTISRLRKKLEEYGNNIITRPGFGYGFSTK